MTKAPYDQGYAKCSCFWGTEPSSLVRRFLSNSDVSGLRVLDLGCGEGKNAWAFASAGATVVAVDSSELAINNGKRAFVHSSIEWVVEDAATSLNRSATFDIIVMYGLLHCLPSMNRAAALIESALFHTKPGGYNILATFNDGPHDLSAHPDFLPTLLPDSFYVDAYKAHEIVTHETDLIHETHPHNQIPHFHSITRLLARKRR